MWNSISSFFLFVTAQAVFSDSPVGDLLLFCFYRSRGLLGSWCSNQAPLPLVDDDNSPITPLASVIRCQAYRAYLRVKRYSQWANDEARRDDSFIHGEDARSWNVALNTRADR